MNDKEVISAEGPGSPPIGGQKSSRNRILVVDDDSDARQRHVMLLLDSGYDVEDATNGADGWEALHDRHFDLVITDNRMPKMTGVEMIEKLRFSRMTIPVIMATGHMPTFEFARKPWLRPDLAMVIPFSDDEFLTAIRNLLPKDDHVRPEPLLQNNP
jgi:DNA-binding response OmpR family regulator